MRKEKTGENSKMKHQFFHECQPPTATAQTRRHHGAATYLPAKTKIAQATWIAIMKMHAPEKPISAPVRVSVSVTWARPKKRAGGPFLASYKQTKPDVDNMAKMILDAGTKAGWWEDDAHIASLTLEKWEGDMQGIAVAAETINQEGGR
jgi:Holliday junction resolvase RusA-like endonuclease